MLCSGCGSTVEEGARFCGVCGKDLQAPEPAREQAVLDGALPAHRVTDPGAGPKVGEAPPTSPATPVRPPDTAGPSREGSSSDAPLPAVAVPKKKSSFGAALVVGVVALVLLGGTAAAATLWALSRESSPTVSVSPATGPASAGNPGAPTLTPNPTLAPTTATPSTATPSTATPSTATPSTATPSTATPSTATPSTATPSTATPTPATPGTAPTLLPSTPGDDEPRVPSAPPRPPSVEAATGAHFASSDSPLSRELYLERVADQVDLRYHRRRADEVRFWLQSSIVHLQGAVPAGLGDPRSSAPVGSVQRSRIGEVRSRHAWAVPLGTTTLARRRVLAVGTSRCLLDYRFPLSGVDSEWRNLAIFSDVGRNPEVFRLGGIGALPGVTATFDPRADRTVLLSQRFLEGRQGERYFDAFLGGTVPPLGAKLVIGDWRDASGVDFVVLYFPLDDPGVTAIAPTRHLGLVRQVRVLRETLEARPWLWSDRFDFQPRSGGCQREGEYRYGSTDWDEARGELYAAAGGLSSVASLLLRPLREVGSTVSRRIVERGRRAVGPVWRSAIHPLRAGMVSDVSWSAQGRLVLAFALGRGRASPIVLGGVTREGLDDAAAARVIETVRAIASGTGAVLAIVRSDAHGALGALFVPGAELDVAAELLRRGRARLDLDDAALLAQQPALAWAAERGTHDPTTRDHPAVADPGYRTRVATAAAGEPGR